MFTLKELPYAPSALTPHMSEETFSYHYGKHHQTYVNNLNNLVANAPEHQNKSLEEIIKSSQGGIFNNAA